MLEAINEAYRKYSRNTFLFIWSSLMYVVMFFVLLFALAGIFLIYFYASSLLGITMDVSSLRFIIPVSILALIFFFLMNGSYVSLIRAYANALDGRKTSLVDYHRYLIKKAPLALGIFFVEYLLLGLVVGPIWYVYTNYLADYEFMDIITGIFVFLFVFAFHMVFTPAFVAAGTFGSDLYDAFNRTFRLIKKRHVFYIVLFTLVSAVWFINLIPILNLCSMFIFYPILLAALIVMMRKV